MAGFIQSFPRFGASPFACFGDDAVARGGSFFQYGGLLFVCPCQQCFAFGFYLLQLLVGLAGSSSELSMYCFRLSTIPVMTGNAYLAKMKNTIPNIITIQNSVPGSGVSSPISNNGLEEQCQKTNDNGDEATPSIKAAAMIIFIRTLLDSDGCRAMASMAEPPMRPIPIPRHPKRQYQRQSLHPTW